MLLSVIIVHYRVPYFLEVCLLSVQSALQGLDAEIVVIDNDSKELSPDFLRPRFPSVQWIANTENVGFARASNQGLAVATGDHLLFLNPDTVLPEDFARNCLDLVGELGRQSSQEGEVHAKAVQQPRSCKGAGSARVGGLGVRMIDGNGRFLKESRRGFPTPWAAFCRLAGLSSLFPRSRWFAGYYLGYLPADRMHPAPVLSGACLWVSREALDAAGPFDEDFFMYAEDIDLSYRIINAGFCNYYLPDTTIIHFKGASTEKDLRYIRQFYSAMSQFRRKHFHSGMPGLFRAGIEWAIKARAGLAAAGHAFRGSGRRSFSEGVIISTQRPAGTQQPTGMQRPARRTWMTGDPTAVEQLRPHLESNRTIVTDPQQAMEIVFCQGPAFSFKDLISAWGNIGQGKTAGIYAAGAGAMLVSLHHDNRVEILKL